MILPASGRLLFRIAFAAALFLPAVSALGETAAPENADAANDAMKRLEWLKSRTPPTPAPRRTYFRTSESRTPGLRVPDSRTPATPAPAAVRPPEAPTSTPRPAEPPPATPAARATPAPTAQVPPQPTPKKRVASSPTPAARAPLATAPKPTPARPLAESTPVPRLAATPAPRKRIAEVPAATPRPAVVVPPKSSVVKALPSTPAPALASKNRTVETKVATTRSASASRTAADSRYPWKTNIVTTVFWVGEPTGGNNFVHNRSSSWDVNWAQNFGGYDNPNPEARRRYIAAKFTPRQNPFYVALPYNDVTRGTTKPEARAVIPWFKEAFQREGLSVCRDRWVAVRNRAGKIAYAQWSDCGPFRTDHWQYVFGKEKPKPNLNKGAGLDVSPAMRDYLGLDGTDLTDWKFVDFKDVPSGPWALYGENNPFTQRSAPSQRRVVKSSTARSSETLARNP